MAIQSFSNGESLASVRSKINANFAELDDRPTGTVDSVVAGTNISVDGTDPANPEVSFQLGADENFVTDAEKAVLASTSGTNTGDQDLSALATKSELDGYALNCDSQHAITDYTFDGTERRNSGYLVTTASNRTVNVNPDLFATGFEVSICKGTNNANTVTLDAGSGNNINGSQTFVLTQYNEVVTLLKDGASTWKIKSHYYPIIGTNTGDQDALGTPFDNSGTDLVSENVEDAIKEVNDKTGGGGGSSLWTTVAGTRTGNTTFTVTGDHTATFMRGLVVKWTESSAVKCAMVVSSSFSSVTTVTIVGDAMASIDSSSLKYCATPAEKIKFATAGSIGTVASDVANAHYAFEAFRVLAADIAV